MTNIEFTELEIAWLKKLLNPNSNDDEQWVGILDAAEAASVYEKLK